MKTIRLLGTALLVWSAFSVQAHDLLLIPSFNGGNLNLRVQFGHPEEWELPEVHRLYSLIAYPPQMDGISWLNGFATNGVNLTTAKDLQAQNKPGTWVVAGSYDNGFWVHVDDNTLFNTDKNEFPSAKTSGHFLKYAKTLFVYGAASADYKRRLGYRLELVPLSDPFLIKIGQSLPVQALYEGKPLIGVGLEIGDGKTKIKEEDIPRYKTNSDGVAQMPVSRNGLQIIAVDYETPSRTPDASEEDNYSSTLTFVVP